jgi:hypothetical protein
MEGKEAGAPQLEARAKLAPRPPKRGVHSLSKKGPPTPPEGGGEREPRVVSLVCATQDWLGLKPSQNAVHIASAHPQVTSIYTKTKLLFRPQLCSH